MMFCLSRIFLSELDGEYVLALMSSSRRSPLWGYIPTSLRLFFLQTTLHYKACSSHSYQTSAFSENLKLPGYIILCQDTGSCRMSPCSWTQLVKACTGSPHLRFEKKKPMERISFLWSPRHLLLFGQRWKSPKSRSFSNRAKVAISFTQKAHIITQVGID